MKKAQWRERTDGRTDCGQRGGAAQGEGGKRRKKPSIWKGSSAARATETGLLQGGESIVSFRPNCSAISGVFFLRHQPIG